MERSPVLAACGLAFEAAILAGAGLVTACAPGPARMAARLEALLGAEEGAGRGAWAGILSVGCAGALDPALAAGACVVATEVEAADGVFPTDPAWTRALLACLPGAREGRLAGVDTPLVSSAEKTRLRRGSGACAADMESHAVARAARRHGLPFAACRVVLDPAWRSLPACALAGLREDGGQALWPLLLALAAAPGELGALCLLAADAARARRTLRRVGRRLAAIPGHFCCPSLP